MPESHFCHGYTDEHGIWNNGFYCPKWGDPGERYCCSDERAHFCCPPPSTTSTRPLFLPPLHPYDVTTPSSEPRTPLTSLVAIIAGVTTGVFFIALSLAVCVALCAWRKRTKRQARHKHAGNIERGGVSRSDHGSIVGRSEGSIMGSMGTMSSVAGKDSQRPSLPCSKAGSEYLQWGNSPATRHHPLVTMDSSRKHDSLAWPPEFDQVVRLRLGDQAHYLSDTRAASPASDVSKQSAHSSEHRFKRMQPDLLCLSSFRHPGLSSPGLTGFTRADIERCKGLTRVDMERGSVTRAELERCKRDSGVLIEDTDTMSDDNSTITMLSNMHQHFSHLRLLPPLPFTTVLRSPLHSPRSQDGTSSPCPTHCSSERQLQC